MSFLEDSVFIAKFNPSNYVKELLIGFVTFFLVLFISNIHFVVPVWLIFNPKSLPLSISIIRLIIWAWLFFALKTTCDGIEEALKTKNYYRFNANDWPKKWTFHGGIHLLPDARGLIIENSGSGCLLKSYIWKNFELTFNAKFINKRSFGTLMRAENLESYYMLELRIDKEKLYVKPHVRMFGQWEYTDYKEILNCDVMDYFRVKIELQDQILNLSINDSLVYTWTLPDNEDFRGKLQQNSDEATNSQTVLKTPFIKKYGMIGFRADYGQGVEIRDLAIKSI